MQIIEVTDKNGWRLFHQAPHNVYKNQPHWIAPLESDIEKIFSPNSNKAMQNGAAKLFVLLNEKGTPVGRIAAFVDHQRNLQQSFPQGGIGFFECIDNKDYARALLEKAEAFLVNEKVKAIDGPVNFGERDKFWGLLVKGQEYSPLYQENYHPTYYKAFFEDNGYEPYEQILTLKGSVGDVPLDRIRSIAKRLRERYGLTTRSIEKSKLEWYADLFRQVYNEAFRTYPHFKPLHTAQVYEGMKQAKPILDPNLVCFAFEKDQPIGFLALLPDINQFLQPAKGKLDWLRLPGFLWRFKTAKQWVAKGIASAIHPDFQRKGIFPLIVDHLAMPANLKKYSHIFLATIRSHNQLMVETAVNLGVKPDRVHVAYRKMLDKNIPLDPYMFMDV